MPRPKRPPMTVTGRPLIPIDWDWVDQQLMAGCIGTEVAAGLNMHPDTLYTRTITEKGMTFTAYSSIKSADGERLLRRKQFDTALKGNVTMQIWLGKQRLEQREHTKDELKGAAQNAVRDAIREIEGNARDEKAGRSELAPEQPVFDQGCVREQDQV